MTRMGRKHRPYYRIVAIDSRQPRNGRSLEELGTFDPMIKNKDLRITLKADRVQYWMSVGALPTDKVRALIEKYNKKAADAPAAPPPTPAPAQG